MKWRNKKKRSEIRITEWSEQTLFHWKNQEEEEPELAVLLCCTDFLRVIQKALETVGRDQQKLIVQVLSPQSFICPLFFFFFVCF